MKINKSMSVAEVNEQFRKLYPNLKLLFFESAHDQFKGSHLIEVLGDQVSIEMINSLFIDGEIELSGDMSVADLEGIFEDRFGLHVQVFRKSGDAWLETTASDHWSLGKQEKQASRYETYINSK